MKKIYFISFFVLQTLVMCAQDFAPIGAKWYYSRPYVDENNFEFVIFEPVKDTVINNKNCREIDITNSTNLGSISSKEYIYQNGGSVFYYNSGSFFLLYNFSANEGDTIIVHNEKFKGTGGFLHNDTIQLFKYKIVEIDSINISGVWLKRQKIEPIESGVWGFVFGGVDSYIYEKLGSLGYFFGRFGTFTTQESMGLLRCYSDLSVTYENPDWAYSCDYITDINMVKLGKNVKIFPNPSEKIISIISDELIDRIVITDITGNIVKIINNKGKCFAINIESFKSGVYFMKIKFNKNNYYQTTKIIKL